MTQPDDRAVHAVLDGIYAAFAAGDAEKYVHWYAENATVVMPGMWLHDRAALRSTIDQLFAGPPAGATGPIDVQSIRYPPPTRPWWSAELVSLRWRQRRRVRS